MNLIRKTEVSNRSMTESEYRSLNERLSYSLLKLYAQNRPKFYKQVICQEITPKESSNATIVGDIAHVLLADNQGEFDTKFHITSVDPPKGQLGELCEILYRRAIKSVRYNEQEGTYTQTERFETLFQEAVQQVKYDYNMKEIKFVGKNLEKILELFTTPDKDGNVAEMWYKEALNCIGKQIVTQGDCERAEKVVQQLKTHPYTADIVNAVSHDHIEIWNEMIILYMIDNIQYRSMVDKNWVDHKAKTIQPWDYKCTYDVENGWEYSYLKFMYHLQVGLYDIGLIEWTREHKLEGYTVLPMKYIACDTTGNAAPVIYTMTEKDVLLAKRGFSVRGKRYPGVIDIHEDIQWNVATGIWNTTKAIHEANGQVQMDIKYR